MHDAVEAGPEGRLGHARPRQHFLVDEVVEDLGDAQAIDQDALCHAFSRSGWLGRFGDHAVLDQIIDLARAISGLLENVTRCARP